MSSIDGWNRGRTSIRVVIPGNRSIIHYFGTNESYSRPIPSTYQNRPHDPLLIALPRRAPHQPTIYEGRTVMGKLEGRVAVITAATSGWRWRQLSSSSKRARMSSSHDASKISPI